MREAQLRNIEAKYRNSIQEIEDQRDVSVSFGLELAGLVNVVSKPKEVPILVQVPVGEVASHIESATEPDVVEAIPVPSATGKFEKVISLSKSQMKELNRRKGGIVALLEGKWKSPLEMITERTGAMVYISKTKERIKIVASSEKALEHAIHLLEEEVNRLID